MRWMKVLLVLFACATASPSVAAPFDDAMAAYIRGDRATALRLLRPLADKGVDRAQYNLGFMYEKGQSVPQDYVAAASWYRKAADQGFANAQYNLGVMYYNGQGVPQDYAAALLWFGKAADQGFAGAQYNLGFMYEKGQGVPQDYVQAHLWFNLAASRVPANDHVLHDRAIDAQEAVASKMTPTQMAEARRLAREWEARARTVVAMSAYGIAR